MEKVQKKYIPLPVKESTITPDGDRLFTISDCASEVIWRLA
jgi:hypothetical protein